MCEALCSFWDDLTGESMAICVYFRDSVGETIITYWCHSIVTGIWIEIATMTREINMNL